jgi:hypothetical protein
MATQIKITELGNITSPNLVSTTLFPVVNMVGTPITQKATLQQIGNMVLASAGSANFSPANLANIAYSVANAAQPNITSVGTLTSLVVSGNISVGGGNITTKSNTGYNVIRNTTVAVDNIVARVASNGRGQISLVSGTSNVAWCGSAILSGIQTAFNNVGVSVSSGVWQDVSASAMTTNGDAISTTLQNATSIYRISFVQSANIANATTVIEKLV